MQVRRGVAALGAALLTTGLVGLGPTGLAGSAVAAPHAAPQTTAAPPVTITAGQTWSTRSNDQAQDVRVALPAGLTPRQVTGKLIFDNDAVGRVEILVDGTVVAAVAKRSTDRTLPVRFPITAKAISDGYLVFQLRYTTTSAGGASTDLSCVDTGGNVQLSDVLVGATGTAKAPTTLATFFGPAVDAVSITVPSSTDASLQEAALDAEAAVVHLYPDAKVTVTTPQNAARAATGSGLQARVVTLTPGTGEVQAAITAPGGVPTLTLTGDPAKLPAAAAALGSTYLALDETPSATSLSQTGIVPGRDSETFADLGQSAPSVQGLGQSSYTLNVKQSDFGAAVDHLQVHLVGRYNALPPEISAVLTYYWNNQLIGSQVLTKGHTAIDRTLDVAGTQLSFANTLKVQLNAIPSGKSGEGSAFSCNGPLSYLPILATFDGKASTITATRGQSTDPGFPRFPQVLGNVFTAAFGGATVTPDDLTNAAALLRALQQLNSAQLSASITTADGLISSSAPGVLLDATADQVTQLNAPLKMDAFRSIDQTNVHFGVGVQAPYAALQAFNQNGRDLLVLSSWSPDAAGAATGSALQGSLVDSIVTGKQSWYGMWGDLAVRQSAAGENVLADSNSIVPQPATVHHLSAYAWWIIGFVVFLGLLLVGQAASKRRLRRRARRLVDAQRAADAEHQPELAEPDDTAPWV